MDIKTLKEVILIVENRIKENRRLRETIGDNLVEQVVIGAKIVEGQEFQELFQGILLDELKSTINLLNQKK